MYSFWEHTKKKKNKINQIHTSNALVKVSYATNYNEYILAKIIMTNETNVRRRKKICLKRSDCFAFQINAIIGNVRRHHFVFLRFYFWKRKIRSPWVLLFVILSDRNWIECNGFSLKSRRKYADDKHNNIVNEFFHNISSWCIKKSVNAIHKFGRAFITHILLLANLLLLYKPAPSRT